MYLESFITQTGKLQIYNKNITIGEERRAQHNTTKT